MRWLEVQLQRFLKIRERFFLCVTLTGDVEFQTLRDIPVSLTPNGRGEWSLHMHYCCKYRPTASAAFRPSAIAHTTNDCPRRASPAAKTPGTDVW
jgi:hypothetical protein